MLVIRLNQLYWKLSLNLQIGTCTDINNINIYFVVVRNYAKFRLTTFVPFFM